VSDAGGGCGSVMSSCKGRTSGGGVGSVAGQVMILDLVYVVVLIVAF
jgi:hypothetical protein